jgi:hypothetical protein
MAERTKKIDSHTTDNATSAENCERALIPLPTQKSKTHGTKLNPKIRMARR